MMAELCFLFNFIFYLYDHKLEDVVAPRENPKNIIYIIRRRIYATF